MGLRWQQIDLLSAAHESTFCHAWNDLWHHSTVALPLARIEHLLEWHTHFAPSAPLSALIVGDDDELLAALPLMPRRLKKLLPIYCFPSNNWAWAGDLLVDWSTNDMLAVMDQLVLGIQSIKRPWLWFDGVSHTNPAWQQLLAACERRNLPTLCRPRFDIGVVNVHGDNAPQSFEAYQASWSSNFRRQMRKMVRRAEELGGVQLRIERPTSDNEIELLMQTGFSVEDQSWKGVEGTSLIKQPAIYNFFVAQAKQLARHSQLELVFLDFQGTPIAFEYGYWAKGVYYSPKVGYNEKFSHLSPGQLLRYLLLEKFFADPERKTFDFLGPLVSATAKWTTAAYPTSRLIISTGNCGGNFLLRQAENWIPRIKNYLAKFRGNRQPQEAANIETAEAPTEAEKTPADVKFLSRAN